ncbi:hypothetical protein [Geodermatophilus sp. CPCC 205506]|uniref:hypothetical protein n=1 Tax=Geodermatophilus sp. CPCC 205506 TaxID=2936596 RepID=UPI003EEAFD2C
MPHLFANKQPTDEQQERWERIERTISQAAEDWLSDPEKVEDAIAGNADADVPTLQRDQANYNAHPTDNSGIRVRCLIPFTGREGYFYWRVAGVESPPIEADVNVPSSFDRDRIPKTVSVNRLFAAGTTTEQAQAWATEQADLIEKHLNALRPIAEEQAQLLRQNGEKLAADRLSALRTARELQEGLGRGV